MAKPDADILSDTCQKMSDTQIQSKADTAQVITAMSDTRGNWQIQQLQRGGFTSAKCQIQE